MYLGTSNLTNINTAGGHELGWARAIQEPVQPFFMSGCSLSSGRASEGK